MPIRTHKRLPRDRRLAAIVAADIAGYSTLMGADEERTVRDLKGHQSVLLPMIARSGGRLVDTAGDGFLAEFPSVLKAVRFAIDMQNVMAARNASVEPERRMHFRVGINQGDILIDATRIYGDGVNVAARLEALAEPGGVCVTSKVYEEVRDKLDLSWLDLGEQKLKNIRQPVRVYRASNDGEGDVSEQIAGDDNPLKSAGEILRQMAAPPIPKGKPSIAVLPFLGDSLDADHAYFTDGVCEDVITALSRISGLLVIGRSSSFAYKGMKIDAKRAGQELGVAHVLEGSVRILGNRIRINVELVNTITGAPIWADRYDRDLSDAFAVQDEITQEIVLALEVTLTQGEQIRTWRSDAISPQAYQHFALGREAYLTFTRGGMARARKHLEKAIGVNPRFSIAHAYLGFTHA